MPLVAKSKREIAVRKLLLYLMVLSALGSSLGCEKTADGIGKDVEKVGDNIKDATN